MQENPKRQMLETPSDVAKKAGLSQQKIRGLIREGSIEFIIIGSRTYIPAGAFERFLDANTVKPCPEETKARALNGSQSGRTTTLYGPKTDAAKSAQQVQTIAKKLKQH